MQTHIEPLPARRHLAATPDPSFGTSGKVDLGDAGGTLQQVVPVTGGLLALVKFADHSDLRRLAENGAAVTGWGDDGVASVPLASVDAMAFDKRTGRLLIAGRRARDEDATVDPLYVLRLAADGKPDSTFGDNGVFVYTPTVVPPQYETESTSAAAVAETITPLPHGATAIALAVSHTRSNYDYDPEFLSHYYDSTSTTDLVLMRLRSSGRRDLAFGRRGVRVFATGQEDQTHFDGDKSGESTIYHTKDVLVRPDGSFKAAVSVRYTKYENYDGMRQDGFGIVTRGLTADGGLDRSNDAKWALHASRGFGDTPLQSFNDVLVRATESGAFAIGDVQINYQDTPLKAYVLTPGKPAAALSTGVPANVVITNVYPIRRRLLAVGHPRGDLVQTSVLRLLPNDKLDVAWADGGILTRPNPGNLAGVTPDAEGRLLEFDDATITRLLV